MQVTRWMMRARGEPLVAEQAEVAPEPGEVLVEVAGCGVCHTDLGFLHEGVPTRHELPLTLGHEISGRVVASGQGCEDWQGRCVVVPAVMPCGSCPACKAGRGSVCPDQVFPGNDVHGGFASHVCVPARGLCPVPDLEDPASNPRGLGLADLSVVADAVSTPYQAIRRSGVGKGDLAVVVGVGGVGGFAVQIASALEAVVMAVDVDAGRLELMDRHGAAATADASAMGFRELRRRLRDLAGAHGIPTWRTSIFECSGTAAGQNTAFGLLGHGGWLSVVGFTPEKVELRLSNLMALDATAQGNWGCLPEHYPGVVDLVLSGRVALKPFVEYRPLGAVNQALDDVRARRTSRRVILQPES